MSTDTEPRASSQRKRRAAAEDHRKTSSPQPESRLPNDRKTSMKEPFSEEDEIHLLRAFLEVTNDCPSPPTAASTLFERVGKSLSVEITHSQLIEKLRNLRNNYSKQALNKDFSIKNLSLYEREVFEISRKIWGGDEAHMSSNGPASVSRSAKKKKKNKKKKTKEKKEEETLIDGEDLEDVELDLEKSFPFLMEEMSRLRSNETMMEALKKLDRSELERLNKAWRSQQIREGKLMMEKDRLVQETKWWILEAVLSQIRD